MLLSSPIRALLIGGTIVCACCLVAAGAGEPPAEQPSKITPIRKADAEWRKSLTRQQFDVTRRKATEKPYSGKLLHNKRTGTYRCVCCGLELFDSATKFDSQTGWPSFWQSLAKDHVRTTEDTSEQPVRMEVLCARCDAHLGHVFDDGPPPTGLRFCMNSIALDFVASADKSGKAKTEKSDKAGDRSKARKGK